MICLFDTSLGPLMHRGGDCRPFNPISGLSLCVGECHDPKFVGHVDVVNNKWESADDVAVSYRAFLLWTSVLVLSLDPPHCLLCRGVEPKPSPLSSLFVKSD